MLHAYLVNMNTPTPINVEHGDHIRVYRCLVKGGHVGSGKYYERMIYIQANNILEAMNLAKVAGGVKKGHFLRNGGAILTVEPVG